MHGSRITVLAGTALAGSTLFLPLVRLSGPGTTDGFEGDAWPVMILLVPGVLASLTGHRAAPLRPLAAVVTVASACLGFLFSLAKLLDAARAADRAVGTVEVGAWATPAAVLVVIGGALFGLAASAARRSGEDRDPG